MLIALTLTLTPPAIGKFALAVAGGTGLGIVAWWRVVLRPIERWWERRERKAVGR